MTQEEVLKVSVDLSAYYVGETLLHLAGGLHRNFRKDSENITGFAEAVVEKLDDLDEDDAERMMMEIWKLVRLIGECIPNPRKASLGWLFGFDPFKPVRFEADRIARQFGLDWERR